MRITGLRPQETNFKPLETQKLILSDKGVQRLSHFLQNHNAQMKECRNTPSIFQSVSSETVLQAACTERERDTAAAVRRFLVINSKIPPV